MIRALLALLLGFGLYKVARPTQKSIVGVRAAKGQTGVDYEVFRRGGDTYEVMRRDKPETYIIFGDSGEIDTRGSEDDLALMRTDMQKFPKDLFA